MPQPPTRYDSKGASQQMERDVLTRQPRTTPARAKALLMRMGTDGEPREDDRMDTPDEP